MRIKIKAVFTGVMVDLIGTLTIGNGVGVLVGVLASFYFMLRGFEGGGVERNVKALAYDPVFMGCLLFIGCFFTFMGGFFAAMKVNAHEFSNAFVVGIISTIIGLLFWYYYHDPDISPLYIFIGSVLTAPAAMAGGGFMLYLKCQIRKAEAMRQQALGQ